MPSVQVKHVPPKTHAELTRRAEAAHQSLQEYLLALLVETADTPPLEELLDRLGRRRGGTAPLTQVAELIRTGRDGR